MREERERRKRIFFSVVLFRARKCPPFFPPGKANEEVKAKGQKRDKEREREREFIAMKIKRLSPFPVFFFPFLCGPIWQQRRGREGGMVGTTAAPSLSLSFFFWCHCCCYPTSPQHTRNRTRRDTFMQDASSAASRQFPKHQSSMLRIKISVCAVYVLVGQYCHSCCCCCCSNTRSTPPGGGAGPPPTPPPPNTQPKDRPMTKKRTPKRHKQEKRA